MAKSKRKKAQQSDDSSDIDLSGLAKRLKKVPIQTWVLLLLLLIPIFLAAYFRAYPATLPVTDQWADNSIRTNARNILDQQVRVNFPNLPAQNRAEVVDEEWAKLTEKNQALIYDPQQRQVVQVPYDQALAGYSASFKQAMQNDKGETYLLAIDPWVYYMVARNIATNGHAGDTLKDGEPWNSYAGAPYGGSADNNLHSHIQYYTYKVLKIFKPGMSVMGGAFWVPLIIAALSVIPAFFIVRRKAGIFGGFIAATIIAVHSAYLGRTPAGFSDTDAYNVFFPLLVAWLFLEALETKDLKKKLILAGGAGLALGAYSNIWVGWWYIFDIILAAIVGYIGFVILKQVIAWYRKKEKLSPKKVWDSVKGTVMLTAVFVVVTGAIVSYFYNLQFFLELPLQAIQFSQLKVAANPNLWPNVLTTVAELNEVNFGGVVGQMGGKFLYALALIGVASALLPFKRRIKGKDLLFIGLALLITVYLVSAGALQRSAISYLILLGLPLLVGLIMLLFDKRDIDVKYALLILIWFIVSMYA
ncbi:MAG: hypothetical protein DRP42_05895, partial [Tenericutes bacterium]